MQLNLQKEKEKKHFDFFVNLLPYCKNERKVTF